ncbi:MAG TPA: hypothetical protein VMW42_09640 [Desulfatiglandales bacterium]|nr:hypothetical protein [Desulfatiglandales bacterium]
MKAKNNKNTRALREQKKNVSEKSVEEIIQENHDLLLEVFQGKIPRQKLRLKIEQQLAGWQFKESAEDEKKHLRLYRVSLLLRLENIRQSLRNPNISDNKRFCRIYELMAHRNELSGVEQKIEIHDDHKVLNSARKLWEESDRKVRQEMAEYLKCMSPEFSCDTIHKKLSSFVAKHGRV